MIEAALESPAMLKLDVVKMKEIRIAAGITQVIAAKRAKLLITRWNDVESGRRSNVTLETLGVIAKALDCDPRDLIIEKPRRPRPPKPRAERK